MKARQIGEVSRMGGWRGSPNSIAALMRCQVPRDQLPKCKRCRQLALRGQDVCAMHAGSWYRRRLNSPGHAERSVLARLEGAGLLPLELIALPVWRDLNGIATSQRAPMRLALVRAWDKRFTAPLHWAQVQRQALDLARQPGQRQNTAWYYENR